MLDTFSAIIFSFYLARVQTLKGEIAKEIYYPFILQLNYCI
jgi:hypothetical protein